MKELDNLQMSHLVINPLNLLIKTPKTDISYNSKLASDGIQQP